MSSEHFKCVFCKKSDPQSKGKVENVVKYIKYGFLRGRDFTNIDMPNESAIRWLARTANGLPHSTTKRTKTREHKAYLNRLKQAKLPPKYDLDEYDFGHSTGVSERPLRELRQLALLDQAYNLILMGPSGTGKTYIASGLIYDALKAGKKAYMISLEDIFTCLRTKDISMSALATNNKWITADLIAIDDIMLFPVKKRRVCFFLQSSELSAREDISNHHDKQGS